MAPDVVGVEVLTDATCNLAVGLLLAGAPYVSELANHQTTVIYLDVDGNPGTGDPSGGDVLIRTDGTAGRDERYLGRWDANLKHYVLSSAPGAAFRYGGIRTTFASLGITQPVNLGVRSLTFFEVSGNGISGFDFAPDKPGTGIFQTSFQAPIAFGP